MAERELLKLLLEWSTLAVALGWLLPARWQALAIAACGAALLASISPLSLAVLASLTVLGFLIHRRAQSSLAATIAGIVTVAGVFLGFLVFGAPSGSGIGASVVLPMGMAFYSLRLIHYLLESYKGRLRAHSLDEYLCYQLLPSALPVGPIHRFDEFLRDLRRRRRDWAQFSGGLERVLYGMVKLIVLGDWLIGQKLATATAAAQAAPGLAGAYATALLFWLKLYVLFSGYSDLAIGFGALCGFRLRENFNWPMAARNIGEFWQRWHMSLSSWCRDYVYAPALSITRSHALAVLTAMVTLGLWHSVSLRYLLWGGYHGLGLAVWRRFDQLAGGFLVRMPTPLRVLWQLFAIALTLHFVIFSFAITSALERLILGR